MRKCKILVPIGCRSDEGISAPIIRRLTESDDFTCSTPRLIASDFAESYSCMKWCIEKYKPDLVICVGDRIEMTAAACAAFHNNIPICHYGSGITNYPISTFDDINRHCITLWSDILLCEDKNALKFCINNFWYVNKGTIHVVGITHLDDLVINESLVPEEEYDLVSVNPEPLGTDILELYKQADLVTKEIHRKSIWIEPNPDNTIDLIGKINFDYQNLPRPQYLGLLKNCKRFISNSSDCYYIAPEWLKPEQIIQIGDRNKNRSTPTDLKGGAADKIVKILKEYWRKKND